MHNANTDNPRIGKLFQEYVRETLEKYFGEEFLVEPAIPIGNPAKEHKFDLSNLKKNIVVECKCYTWTDTGNVPSAKLMGLDEAVFYFSFLPEDTTKILCMKRAVYNGKKESLAEYYVRIHGHLLKDVKVFEIDDEGQITIIKN